MYRSVKSRLGNRVGNDGNHVGNADGKMAVNGGETSEEHRNRVGRSSEEVRKKFGTITFWIQTMQEVSSATTRSRNKKNSLEKVHECLIQL